VKKFWRGVLAAPALAIGLGPGFAAGDPPASPQAGARSYAQNYKDMVLASCIAQAYTNDKNAGTDAGSSVSALVDAYLARDYHNPLVEAEIKGVRFDLLKCLDLYHSKALDRLVKRVVINPGRSYRQDNPAPAKP
jgi:hypothetical protein